MRPEDGNPEEHGWERRSILDEPRLSEVVEGYLQLGLDVMVTDLSTALALECSICMDGETGRYKVVYTRPGKEDTGGMAGDAFD
jgi:hypothetical protein